MPNTFSQLYIHHVSAVKYRQSLILPEFEERLHKYLIGIIKELGQTPIQVNGMADHIHIAARLKPSMAPSTFVQKIKTNSSRWINENGFCSKKFAWQVGGGTFSISQSHVIAVRKYIQNQKEHHQKVSFKKEYKNILKSNRIEVVSEFLPEFFEEIY